METIEIERLLSDKLSNVLHTTESDSDQVLTFAGWHASPNGNVVVNVRVSKKNDSHYRCKISSPEGGYAAEGPLADTPEAAIDGVPWSDIDGWSPFQKGD